MRAHHDEIGMLYLVGGLPGSGKSTLARVIAQGSSSVAVSADDYFYVAQGETLGDKADRVGRSLAGNPGQEYCFSPAELPAAHAWCQAQAAKALHYDGRVVVHNTFTQRWEAEPYFGLPGAERRTIVRLFDGGGCSDAELFARNSHGVPLATIAAMRLRWEVDLSTGDPRPPWER